MDSADEFSLTPLEGALPRAQVDPLSRADLAPAPDEDILADRARRWTSRTILVAALTLAVLNAQSIRTWAATLPPSWATQTIRLMSGVWYDQLAQRGLDQPRAAIRSAYQRQKAVGWGPPAGFKPGAGPHL